MMLEVDIGEGNVRAKGGNSLTHGYHRRFGWVWSDGGSVHLLECSDGGKITDSSTSRRLGEYGDVVSVGWSSDTGGDPPGCFLAVHEKTAVTIWEVSGSGYKSSFKLKKKIEDGEGIKAITWHPFHPIICLLCSHGVTLCSLVPDWLVQLTDATYQTGCWTLDGCSLVLPTERSLEVFHWDDILDSQNTWTTRNITLSKSHGGVRCILGLSSQRIVATTDLPLADIINQSNRDAFEPLIVNQSVRSSRTLITDISDNLCDLGSKVRINQPEAAVNRIEVTGGTGSSNLLDRLKEEIASHDKGPIDLTSMMSVYSETDHIESETMPAMGGKESSNYSGNVGTTIPNGAPEKIMRTRTEGSRQPVTGASDLFVDEDFFKRADLGVSRPAGWNLLSSESHRSRSTVIPVFKQSEVTVSDSAHIHLIDLSLSEEAAVLHSTRVPGVISPDLLSYQVQSNTLYIGSRSNQHIQLYRVQTDSIDRVDQQLLSLKDKERPVGLSCDGVEKDALMILVSKPVTSSMSAVFPSASESRRVKLSFRQIRSEE